MIHAIEEVEMPAVPGARGFKRSARSGKGERRGETGADSSRRVVLSCLTALVIDEARDAGAHAFAEELERSMTGLLKTLPRLERRQALLLAFEASMLNAPPDPARLRLVHSR